MMYQNGGDMEDMKKQRVPVNQVDHWALAARVSFLLLSTVFIVAIFAMDIDFTPSISHKTIDTPDTNATASIGDQKSTEDLLKVANLLLKRAGAGDSIDPLATSGEIASPPPSPSAQALLDHAKELVARASASGSDSPSEESQDNLGAGEKSSEAPMSLASTITETDHEDALAMSSAAADDALEEEGISEEAEENFSKAGKTDSKSGAKSSSKGSSKTDAKSAVNPMCSALSGGDACKPLRTLPACVVKPFNGSWLTLYKNISATELKLLKVTSSNAEMLPEADFLGPSFATNARALPKCAVVSSSSGLLGKGYGSSIDRHEVVFRMNNAPTKGFEADVGNKTHVRYTDSYYEGFTERPHETSIAGRWCSKTPCRAKDLNRLLKKKTHALNPLFLDHITTSHFSKNGITSSSLSPGFVTVMLALHVCHEVTLYGFDVKFKSGTIHSWYYSDGLWHQKLPAKVKPEETSKLERRSWEIPNWSFVDGVQTN
ncbi:hypothetical protein CYMTET_13889, partial [Cymbomonas tetramitiformis]